MEMEGPSVTFGFFCGESPACVRLKPAVCFMFTAPACPFAQPPHQRFFPSDASPKLGRFRPQPSHFWFRMFTAPACPFAQPEHQRFFPSDASPKLGTFKPQPSHFLSLMFTAPACPFAQPEHHRSFPSAGSPRLDACGDSIDHSPSLRRGVQEILCKLGVLGSKVYEAPAGRGDRSRPPSASNMASSPACHLHPAVLAFATRAVMQRRLHRARQVLFADVVPNLQPQEQCDGLLPHLSISGAERLSAHSQRRTPPRWHRPGDGKI
jgi:hypothetical protein